ncbi:Phosphoesterase family protein [Candidatus Phytoplasma australiense]|uniref:Phosphoesterase family protein n=2 Tax=Phytoplasma australiense TaxID=59748 RepID=B1V8W9_PHYAS|nr:bifunctional oligoribonuclease/PAP phosphatase NrnA [Candidatus Phytoplasma australiense]AGL89952.1 Mgp-operon protein 1 [Strawberry lethal yellows phytoplasma (CPA) str. NZSb11]CAM11356.1 Phosphoesterase family protein [Candidatus Phytoplasma australiense]
MQIIYEQIKKFDKIIIHGHINPDGDCYGAQLGLKDVIKATFPDKKVYAVGENNLYLSFVGSMDQIEDDLFQNALAIIVDCGEEKRISDNRFKLAQKIIRIDHHLLTDHYGDYQWVDSSYSSCSQMIFDLKENFKMKLTYQGALAMYVGIVADTGNFCFDRVNQYTLKAASSLLAFDLDVAKIFYHLNKENLVLFHYKAYIFQNAIASKGFVYLVVSQAILKKLNLNLDVAASLVNNLGHLENHPVWAFFMEKEDGTFKVSIRSRGPEINHIAQQFKGGGHRRACGATLDSKDQIPVFVEKIQKAIMTFEAQQKNHDKKELCFKSKP